MENHSDTFYLKYKEPVQSCLLALRSIIKKQHDEVSETQKWGLPCFCFRQKPFCYLNVEKKSGEPYLLIVEGRKINHPKLETGNRSKMKVYRVNPEQDLEMKEIEEILAKALNLYVL